MTTSRSDKCQKMTLLSGTCFCDECMSKRKPTLSERYYRATTEGQRIVLFHLAAWGFALFVAWLIYGR